MLAHVRRATVGEPKIENSHPFVDGAWAFIHNGTVPNFNQLRPRLVALLSEPRRKEIRGDTDSEHVFHYLRDLQEREPSCNPMEVLRVGLCQIINWCREINPAARIGLNVILTDGEQMIGSRLGRTLYYVERQGVHDCEICGFPHIHHDPHRRYRAVIVASEPISREDWCEVPEGSVYRVTEHFKLESHKLFMPAASAPPSLGTPTSGPP